jgi:hypothetical protein
MLSLDVDLLNKELQGLQKYIQSVGLYSSAAVKTPFQELHSHFLAILYTLDEVKKAYSSLFTALPNPRGDLSSSTRCL